MNQDAPKWLADAIRGACADVAREVAAQPTVPCEPCHGSGIPDDPELDMDCGFCGGSGRVPIPRPENGGQG